MRFFFLFVLSFLFVNSVESTAKSPFVWLVEKEGKTSYLFGTVHVGISLEEMPCSDQVLNQIENSDLLFMETKPQNDFERLSEEEKEKVFIGSVAEKEKILSKLSLESQDIIREREAALDNLLRNALPFHIQSESFFDERAFSELSPESQEFLIKHGVNPEGDHADFFHSIRFIVYDKAYSSLPSLGGDIKKIALSQSIEIQALDDNKKINEDVRSQAHSNKPPMLVNYMFIEQLIRGIDALVQQTREGMLQVVQAYKSYDVNYFKGKMSGIEVDGEDLNRGVFLKNRNKLWLKKFMEANEKYDQIFLVTGLDHLIGDHNLLDMLEENGFSVERMTCPK